MDDQKLKIKAYSETIGGKMMAIASEEVADRDGDVISIDGWELKNFKANPVLMWLHMMDGHMFPIGRAKNIGYKLLDGRKKLVFEPEFHDITEEAKIIKQMYEEGWLKTFSVGFRPLEFEKISSDIEFPPRYKYTKQELVEISAVSIPALPSARVIDEAGKKGFNMMILKSLLPSEKKPEEEKKVEVAGNVEVKDAAIVEKAGRVLSSKNEGKIRSAVTLLNEVVSILDVDKEEEKAEEPEVKKEDQVIERIDKLESLIKHLIGEMQAYRQEKDRKIINEKTFNDEDMKDALRIVAQAAGIALKKAKSITNTSLEKGGE